MYININHKWQILVVLYLTIWHTLNKKPILIKNFFSINNLIG